MEKILCCYGCGNEGLYRTKGGKPICEASYNKCPVNRHKNSNGCKLAYSSNKRKPHSYVYENLPEDTKERMNWNKNNFSKTEFIYDGKGSHRKVLIHERGNTCECCGLNSWNGLDIILELDHIDGDNRNQIKSNLRLLCPNCHSQTPSWRGRNINSGKLKVTNERLIEALSESTSIRQALLKVGLAAKGGNYTRCNEMIKGGLVKLANTPDLSSDASA